MVKKKRSKLDRITWILTELVLGLALSIYGLYGILTKEEGLLVLHAVIAAIGVLFLVVAIVQILVNKKRKKKEEKIEHCPKCGAKIIEEDEFCRKCGKKIE